VPSKYLTLPCLPLNSYIVLLAVSAFVAAVFSAVAAALSCLVSFNSCSALTYSFVTNTFFIFASVSLLMILLHPDMAFTKVGINIDKVVNIVVNFSQPLISGSLIVSKMLLNIVSAETVDKAVLAVYTNMSAQDY
jgi:hypothetical protein